MDRSNGKSWKVVVVQYMHSEARRNPRWEVVHYDAGGSLKESLGLHRDVM